MEQPFVSVVIPVYKDWERLRVCLTALGAQTYPKALFEIVVVNNAPADAPPSDLYFPSNARLLTEGRPGSYAARNTGVAASSGDLLAFTDADCEPTPNWLSTMVELSLLRGDSSLISGKVEMVSESNGRGSLNYAEAYDYVFGINQDLYARKGVAATANLMIPRRVFLEVSGFDSTLFSGGDSDFCLRAKAKGFALLHNPKSVVKHPLRSELRAILIKAKRLAGGKFRKNPRAGFFVIIAPPIVRLKILFFDKKAPAYVKAKAMAVVFLVKMAQVHYLFKLICSKTVSERR